MEVEEEEGQEEKEREKARATASGRETCREKARARASRRETCRRRSLARAAAMCKSDELGERPLLAVWQAFKECQVTVAETPHLTPPRIIHDILPPRSIDHVAAERCSIDRVLACGRAGNSTLPVACMESANDGA